MSFLKQQYLPQTTVGLQRHKSEHMVGRAEEPFQVSIIAIQEAKDLRTRSEIEQTSLHELVVYGVPWPSQRYVQVGKCL